MHIFFQLTVKRRSQINNFVFADYEYSFFISNTHLNGTKTAFYGLVLLPKLWFHHLRPLLMISCFVDGVIKHFNSFLLHEKCVLMRQEIPHLTILTSSPSFRDTSMGPSEMYTYLQMQRASFTHIVARLLELKTAFDLTKKQQEVLGITDMVLAGFNCYHR